MVVPRGKVNWQVAMVVRKCDVTFAFHEANQKVEGWEKRVSLQIIIIIRQNIKNKRNGQYNADIMSTTDLVLFKIHMRISVINF